ncbi:hypothetical protein GBAR_LOCUS31464 [Geodia barretti]|nr:hypothetical protein GBAR_LOCUS31464 [Geodia barretti]
MTSPSATQTVEFDIQETPLPTSDSKSGMTGPTISGIDRANDDTEGSNPLVFIIPVSVVAGFVLLSLAVFAFMMTYVHCKSQRQGSYSFGNPAALDIAGAVSTNTLKRGQVTRTSFRSMGSSGTSQNTPETVAILSQPRDSTRASSTISGSESFEWNHT